MEFQEVLQKRQSIRSYLPDKVEEEKLRNMIAAASMAPSWKNSQTARYYVVTGEKKLAEVKTALPPFNQKNVAQAPALIVCTAVMNQAGCNPDGTPANELGNGWGIYDCGLQNMNLLLAAAEQGLSTLVMGIRDAQMLRDLLNIPENEAVVSVIGVGYSDAAPKRPDRKAMDEIAVFFKD